MSSKVFYTEEKQIEILEKLEKYINDTPIPIVAEFAYQNKMPRQTLYEFPLWRDTVKRCVTKKEAQLERLSLSGDVNVTMAIFSLKQLGWRDRQEIENKEVTEFASDEEELKAIDEEIEETIQKCIENKKNSET